MLIAMPFSVAHAAQAGRIRGQRFREWLSVLGDSRCNVRRRRVPRSECIIAPQRIDTVLSPSTELVDSALRSHRPSRAHESRCRGRTTARRLTTKRTAIVAAESSQPWSLGLDDRSQNPAQDALYGQNGAAPAR